ncbi:hypothetical protein BKA67DRAFT_539006 [Truncatella angustata]|uniref:Stress-associated endoplasmic reticulum protein n=1 Tax=Truncatella angustata TaxID=152316 RepID=A0A9P8UFF0_9PEZI|nr:uncharacterized protein BKA67DRAFT_539006 [Truncatella angustata]KAH6649003.1 hypothetical protein BKA67DRAFT_539006 [Truncatella angustata]
MAQTPQQRRANEKFAKDQNARRGKSEAERQVRTKQVQKAPISPLWLARFLAIDRRPGERGREGREKDTIYNMLGVQPPKKRNPPDNHGLVEGEQQKKANVRPAALRKGAR